MIRRRSSAAADAASETSSPVNAEKPDVEGPQRAAGPKPVKVKAPLSRPK